MTLFRIISMLTRKKIDRINSLINNVDTQTLEKTKLVVQKLNKIGW